MSVALTLDLHLQRIKRVYTFCTAASRGVSGTAAGREVSGTAAGRGLKRELGRQSVGRKASRRK